MNSMIWALILVIVLGPGILAGILSIDLRSVRFIAKLLNETIDGIDTTQVEAVSATGPSPAGAGLGHRAAGHACLRRHHRVPLGYHHPRGHGAGAGGRGGIGMLMQASINVLAWP